MAIVCLGGCDKKNTSIYHNIIFKEICDIARDKYLPDLASGNHHSNIPAR